MAASSFYNSAKTLGNALTRGTNDRLRKQVPFSVKGSLEAGEAGVVFRADFALQNRPNRKIQPALIRRIGRLFERGDETRGVVVKPLEFAAPCATAPNLAATAMPLLRSDNSPRNVGNPPEQSPDLLGRLLLPCRA